MTPNRSFNRTNPTRSGPSLKAATAASAASYGGFRRGSWFGIEPSCHTAQVDGYFVEGAVPADDVKRLLRERPAARGITAPGMPAGSPGMEVLSGATPAYTVLLDGPDGSTREFATHGD